MRTHHPSRIADELNQKYLACVGINVAGPFLAGQAYVRPAKWPFSKSIPSFRCTPDASIFIARSRTIMR